MRMSIDPKLTRWIEPFSNPWRPKEDTPKEILPELQSWLDEFYRRKRLSDPYYKEETEEDKKLREEHLKQLQKWKKEIGNLQ